MTVLIADDDAEFRRFVKRVLDRENVKRFFDLKRPVDAVVEVGDGEEAVRLARLLHPEVVLMDIAMPGLDGLEAMRRIKAERPDTRVIIVTVHDENVYRKAALEAGADGFVVKKRLMAELVAMIEGTAPRLSIRRPDESTGRERVPSVIHDREWPMIQRGGRT